MPKPFSFLNHFIDYENENEKKKSTNFQIIFHSLQFNSITYRNFILSNTNYFIYNFIILSLSSIRDDEQNRRPKKKVKRNK